LAVTHLDSSLLIDLQREVARELPGPAYAALELIEDGEILGVSVHVVCELRAGAELSREPLKAHEALDRLIAGLLVRHPDERFAPAYAAALAAIHRRRQTIATMDLLIATAALVDDAAVLTANVKHFSRVPGLRVIGY
jgi:tRNA(fMet)-specific endonuclease VapC